MDEEFKSWRKYDIVHLVQNNINVFIDLLLYLYDDCIDFYLWHNIEEIKS